MRALRVCISWPSHSRSLEGLQVRAAAPSRLCVDVSFLFYFASLVTRALSGGRPVYPRHGEAPLGEGNAGCAGLPGVEEARCTATRGHSRTHSPCPDGAWPRWAQCLPSPAQCPGLGRGVTGLRNWARALGMRPQFVLSPSLWAPALESSCLVSRTDYLQARAASGTKGSRALGESTEYMRVSSAPLVRAPGC